jgi:hypothetical protein
MEKRSSRATVRIAAVDRRRRIFLFDLYIPANDMDFHM